MENFKFIGEWLKQRGLILKPTFSRVLRDMCWEFKKQPRKSERDIRVAWLLEAERFILGITRRQHSG